MKKFLFLMASSLLAGSSFASCCDDDSKDKKDFNVSLRGSVEFQSAYRNQKGLEGDSKKLLPTGGSKMATESSASVVLRAENSTDCGLKYGAEVGVQVTSERKSNASLNGTHIFLEDDSYGKVEMGSRSDAAALMAVTGYDIASGAGDDWMMYANLNPEKSIGGGLVDYNPSLIDSFNKAVDANGNKSERSRKLTYYTPKMSGFQFGVSFIPSSVNIGSTSYGNADTHNKQAPTESLPDFLSRYGDVKFKNGVSTAVSYEHSLSDGVDLKLGATFQSANVETQNRANIKSYSLGGVFNYGNYALSASYVNHGKSLSFKKTGAFEGINIVEKPKFYAYTSGVSYKQGPVGVSLVYLHSLKNKNKLNAYTLATDYNLAPGFKPYAEVTMFRGRSVGRTLTDDSLNGPITNKKVRGTVVLVGAKLNF